MSLFDKPINYDRDVVMKYDRNLINDQNYINEREEILKDNYIHNKNHEKDYDIKKHNIIQHLIPIH
jgi:hypothetical protein